MRAAPADAGWLRAARGSALVSNAGALAAANLATAALGFAYWWLAARAFSAREVGLAAAAVSIMNLLAQIGEFGLGPLLISELGRAQAPARLISAALAAAAGCCLALALGYLACAQFLPLDLGGVADTPAHAALFVAGVAATGFAVVLDQSFIARLRGGAQLTRASAFAILKLALLAAVAYSAFGRAGEEALFATWVVGLLLSLGLLGALAGASGRRGWRPPDPRLLRPVFGAMLGHHAINVAVQAPTLLLPYGVAVLLSPEANAPFYAAWTIVNVILLVPASLGAVVVSVARREPGGAAARLRLSLALSAGAVFPASLGCLAFSSPALRLFSPAYPAIAGSSLAWLGFGAIGMAVKYHFVAVLRLADRTFTAAAALAAGAVLELVAARYGGIAGGLEGLTKGWVAAVSVEAAAMGPVVLAAATAGANSGAARARA